MSSHEVDEELMKMHWWTSFLLLNMEMKWRI